ncbi:glycosyltransferase [Brevundimonas sp. R86498]|uniref:glycosyltransferase n=1 Tax=Brevundimonas sp. R86498 TaxID=3093845 RepID=UPI0037C91AE8
MSAARPLAVVHVSPSLDVSYGGPATSVPSLAAALRDQGVAGALVSVDPPAPAADNALITAKGLSWRRARPARVRLGYYAADLVEQLDAAVDEIDARVIHCHSFWGYPAIVAASVARRRELALVVSPRSEFYPGSLRRSRWLKRGFMAAAGRRILSAAAFVHATEPGEGEGARALGYQGRVVLAPNGIDASIGDRLMDRADALRHLNLDPLPARRALFLARLHPRKGLETLLHAWALTGLATRGWRLMIAGDAADPAYAERLRRLSADLGLAEVVDWLGHVDDAARGAALSLADLFVLPSQFENFGLSIAEALACGVPVITTTATPWPALETDGAGWLVPPADAPALGAALAAAAARGAEGLKAMAPAARAAVSRLDWAAAARPLAEAYREITAGATITGGQAAAPRMSRVLATETMS